VHVIQLHFNIDRLWLRDSKGYMPSLVVITIALLTAIRWLCQQFSFPSYHNELALNKSEDIDVDLNQRLDGCVPRTLSVSSSRCPDMRSACNVI
jgi:hypothetical protein